MALWLSNPKRKRKARKAPARKRRRKLAGAALAAHLRKIGKGAGTARRAARRAASPGGSMAKRKRRRANPKRRRRTAPYKTGKARWRRWKLNPKRRTRKHYRRNPLGGGAVKQLMGLAKQGVKDAAGVIVGKAATRMVAGLIPFGANTGMVGTLKQVLVAVGVGYGAHRVMGKEFARMVVAGGIAAPLETLIQSLNIPLISSALSAGESYAALGAYPLAAYPPALAAGGMGDGMGEGMGADYAWSEM